MVSILDARPDRASYRPGDRARIHVKLSNPSERRTRGVLRVRLLSLDTEMLRAEVPLELAARDRVTSSLELALSPLDLRGYGVDVEWVEGRGRVVARAATALDVCSDWTQAPRYGFLTDFAPGERDSRERVAALARYHINAVQFYDWMYRHQEFLPPTPDFTDPLGRALSLETVQRKIRLAHEFGMQALAYAAIYAANPDYAMEHRDELLYDSQGQPLMLADFLNIMNVTNPSWRARLLRECRRALDQGGYDGIHLDQYGYPRMGFGADGTCVDLASELPVLLNAVKRVSRGGHIVFNAVNAWPLDAVAQSSVAPVYVEVWPPHETYRDLREIILHARRLRGGSAPVLAAYLSGLKSSDPISVGGSVNALRRLTAAIYLNGGSHLALGERDGWLCDPYFPNYARLSPSVARVVRADYDFISRYAEYLFDPAWRDCSMTTVGKTNREVWLDVPNYGPNAEADSIWTIVRERHGELTLGLVNLHGLQDPRWDAVQRGARRIQDLKVSLNLEVPVQTVFFASPDYEKGRAIPLRMKSHGKAVQVTVPELNFWGLVIIKRAF